MAAGVAQASPHSLAVTSVVQDPGPPPTLPPERSPSMPPEPGAPADPPPAAKPPAAKPVVKPIAKPPAAKPAAKKTPIAKPVQKPRPKAQTPTPKPTPAPPPTSSKAPPSDNLPPPPEPIGDIPEPLDEPAPEPRPAETRPIEQAPPPAAEGPAEDKPAASEKAETEPADKPKKSKKFRHRGTILEFKIGAAGCFKRICKSQGYHYAKPGLSLGGFLGGNIFGFLDLGLEVMWGAMTPRAYSGRNAVDMFGIDSLRLQQLLEENAEFIGTGFRVDSLLVGSAKMRVLNVGPALRVHVIPRGRISAYVGTALDYQRWRNKYVTVSGPLNLDFHGLALPILGGVGFYPHPNVAVGFEFRWVYSAHLVVVAKHPELHTGAPVALIDMAGRDEGIEVSSGLPTFWHANASLRARF
ncbi:MAG: hypothetical protein ACPG4T_13255 [Nannocystaceae bacterium]